MDNGNEYMELIANMIREIVINYNVYTKTEKFKKEVWI